MYRLDELVHAVNHQLRIDLQQALGHGVHLGHTQRVAQRMRLAVDIGRGDMVQINQRQLANRAARQRLGRPRADAAHANHADMRMAKARQRRLAIQPANAAKRRAQSSGADSGSLITRRTGRGKPATLAWLSAKSGLCAR